MNPDLQGWFNLPKSVKLLDISLFGYGLALLIGIFLYLTIFDQTVQNLMLIFLTAILMLITWNFRTQLTKTQDPVIKKRYFREWFLICLLIVIIIGVLVSVYPVTY
ncbi:MAG: hypothetical protein JSV04_00465 [Candidatus Heimdallarchaeota archaeon]|nr:MAG: hypothetical protein JSV04_00465 [Candidatus Heimdallarchaeota archaeon]